MEERDICWSEKNGDGKGGEYLEEENIYLCRGKGKGGSYLQRRKTEKQKGGNNWIRKIAYWPRRSRRRKMPRIRQ